MGRNELITINPVSEEGSLKKEIRKILGGMARILGMVFTI